MFGSRVVSGFGFPSIVAVLQLKEVPSTAGIASECGTKDMHVQAFSARSKRSHKVALKSRPGSLTKTGMAWCSVCGLESRT